MRTLLTSVHNTGPIPFYSSQSRVQRDAITNAIPDKAATSRGFPRGSPSRQLLHHAKNSAISDSLQNTFSTVALRWSPPCLSCSTSAFESRFANATEPKAERDHPRLLVSDDADMTSKYVEQRVSFDGASQVLDVFTRPCRGHHGAANLCRVRHCVSLSECLRGNERDPQRLAHIWPTFNLIVGSPAWAPVSRTRCGNGRTAKSTCVSESSRCRPKSSTSPFARRLSTSRRELPTNPKHLASARAR